MCSSNNQARVVAIYGYELKSKEDLQFKKGEHLTILHRLTDGNWAFVRNGQGETGLIPLNFVEPDSDPPWLHGKISRKEAEALLENEPPGSFLVRFSGLFTGDYTLSVVGRHIPKSANNVTIQHYHIYSIDSLDGSEFSKFFSLDNKDIFPSLRKLIEHYKTADCGLVHPLTSPVVDMERICMERLREHHWIPREELTLGQKLGHGEFGEVLKAKLGDCDVAVKRYKAFARRQLIYEACIMSELKHENLLELLGVTEEESKTEAEGDAPSLTFCLVTAFSPLGSLLAYLRSRGRSLLGPPALLSFATDVARGLAYMESRFYLHCDVAARNVLLFSASSSSSSSSSIEHPSLYPVAKLADFGLAIRLQSCSSSDSLGDHTDSSLFKASQRLASITRIPIKWTAPETVRTRVFTNKSDVWSFGVMLWELFSYGRLPYPRLMTNEVLVHLEAGERMEAPVDCPKEIYTLMTETWSSEPHKRPSFVHILQRLQRLAHVECVPSTEGTIPPLVLRDSENAYDGILEDNIV